MNTIMVAANMKPMKRRKNPPRRRRRLPCGGLTGRVSSIVEPVPTRARCREPRSNPSEDYGNKTLPSREIRGLRPLMGRRSIWALGQALGEIDVDRFDHGVGGALAPGLGGQQFFVVG